MHWYLTLSVAEVHRNELMRQANRTPKRHSPKLPRQRRFTWLRTVPVRGLGRCAGDA